NWRIADLPRRGAGLRLEARLHPEAGSRLVAPPAVQARARSGFDVTFVHEATADRAGSGIQVLVAAPDGKIGVRGMQSERHGADRVREVQSCYATGSVGRIDDPRQIECLPRPELHAGP